jgi:hypothetical protein
MKIFPFAVCGEKLIVIKRFMLAHIYDNYVLSKIKARALHVFATDEKLKNIIKCMHLPPH